MKDENFTSHANERVRIGNFKELYNKKYGDIANLNHRHPMTPETVFNLAVKYFSWAEDQAIKAIETASFQGVVTENLVHKPRVFTLNGFQLYCGVTSGAIQSWRASPGFSEVMEFIDSVIIEQKYQLAASNLINAGFVGKDIGIDKAEEVNVSNVVNDTQTIEDAVKSVLDKI
ncbi:hypothetical protein I6F53_20375 [Pseudoalteromonas sp. SWN29]|nr:hypothetical protein [Pseudoalteromonas sp. SWN29]